MDADELLKRYATGERDFRKVALVGAHLSGAKLRGANLIEFNLSNLKLLNANLSRSNLAYANLNGSDLRYADLSDANLAGADFTNAKLDGANMSGTILSKIDWTTPLKSLQADFISRLNSDSALQKHLLKCKLPGLHSELVNICGDELKQLREFCWNMADKYKYKQNSPVRDVFINNLKGKLGEAVVKKILADFVNEVDYEQRIGGDGKVDFKLSSNPSVGIQVKARSGRVDTVG